MLKKISVVMALVVMSLSLGGCFVGKGKGKGPAPISTRN
jgi:predicted small secreted protein